MKTKTMMIRFGLMILMIYFIFSTATGCTQEEATATPVLPATSPGLVTSQAVTSVYTGPTPRPIHPSNSFPISSSPISDSPPTVSVVNTPPANATRPASNTPESAPPPVLNTSASPVPTVITVPKISAEEVKQKTDLGSAILLVDVRPKTDFERNHIAGALSLPFAELETRYSEINRDGEIVIYGACT